MKCRHAAMFAFDPKRTYRVAPRMSLLGEPRRRVPNPLRLPVSVLSASHVLQIRNDKADLAVAKMVRRKCWHGHCRPCAHGSGVADHIMQSLGREIFGRILRQVEVRTDVRSTGA